MIIEKLCDLIHEGLDFADICERIKAYQQKIGLTFMLKSVKNFANNGRVSPVLAKIVGLAGICIVGKASDMGTLEPTYKCKGESRALNKIVDYLSANGLTSGHVRISHSQNLKGAEKLKEQILAVHADVEIKIFECRGLCSFYAEKGGILIGYERM